MKIKLSKSQWCQIGKTAGWIKPSIEISNKLPLLNNSRYVNWYKKASLLRSVCSVCGKKGKHPTPIDDGKDDNEIPTHGYCPRCFSDVMVGLVQMNAINKSDALKDVIKASRDSLQKDDITQSEYNEIVNDFQKNLSSILR
jgi:hypothetical protein